MSKSCQQQKMLARSRKHKKHTCTFLVHIVMNHIMVSDLPPNCSTLPDGHVFTAAFVGMDKDRFSSMFLNDIQVRCASGSSCNVHSNAAPVEESPHHCMNCALKFHLCITCSGSRFGDWFLVVTGGGFQNQCSHSMVRRNTISTRATSSCRLWNCALTANRASL